MAKRGFLGGIENNLALLSEKPKCQPHEGTNLFSTLPGSPWHFCRRQDWTGETSLGNGGGRGKLGFVNTWFQKSKL